MSFKTILTHVVSDERCEARLRMTASIAGSLQADVIGFGAQAPWPYADGDRLTRDYEAIAAATRARLAMARSTFEQILSDPAVKSSWRQELGYPDVLIPNHAAPADLVVAYPVDHEPDATTYATPDTLIMATGLPVLLMPRHEVGFRRDRLLIAWKNTREARHAISASLPLIKQASRVLIAAVCKANELDEVEHQLADVSSRLARHGVNAATLAQVDAPGSASERLLRLAANDETDLMILGGYGHSRFREWAMGGVTRDLIDEAQRYVLFVH